MELELRRMLECIVENAAHVVSARFAAMVLITPDRTIAELISSTMGNEVREKIVSTSELGDLLRTVADSCQPLVIPDLSSHPMGDQFPPHHPQLTSLLAVPIKVGARAVALLYFGNRATGDAFTAADEVAATAFSQAAGMALTNSQTFQKSRRREAWLQMGSEMTRLLLNPINRDEALTLGLRRVREISGANTGQVVLLEQSGEEERVTFAAMAGIDNVATAELGSVPLRRPSFLATVIDEGKPIISTDLSSDPRYNPTTAWASMAPDVGLGMFMPLIAAGETMGVLVLTWRHDSSDAAIAIEDANLIEAFADQSALVLHQLQLQEDRERREQWLEAGLRMTRLLLNDIDRDEALRLAIERLSDVSGADYATLITVDPHDLDDTVLAVVEGLDLEATVGYRIGRRGLLARVIETGQYIITDDLTHEEGYDPPPEWVDALSVIGPCMILPLVAAGEVFGVLYLGWRRGSPLGRVPLREVELVENFAAQTALALQHVQSQDDLARMRVLEDRDRIASDLHDVVIQRMFAVEMRLQSAAGLSTDPQVRQRVNDAIGDLDDMTRQVRSTIFSLHHEPSDDTSIRAQLLYEIDSARAVLGFTPRLVVRGPVDRGVPPHVRGELVPAVRDALANAAAHLSPTAVEVTVKITEEELVLTVEDDGADVDEEIKQQAIADLETRARLLGGSCGIWKTAGGNMVEWVVPFAS